MFSGFWRRMHSPWVAIGVCLTAMMLVGLVLFLFQVGLSIRSIQSGKNNPLVVDQRQIIVQRILNQVPITELERTYIASKSKDPILGNPAAKIKITEFLDYQCPFCARSAPALRAFVAKHPQDVSVTLRDFPIESLHPLAMQVAVAARCVFLQQNDSVFLRYHDALFIDQDRASLSDLHNTAANVGADVVAFDRCVAGRQPEQDLQTSLRDGSLLQIQGTPTFFINGYRVPGALDLETLEEFYRQLMKRI